MKLWIRYQEQYSRKQLVLRTLLGVFYLIIPHAVVLVVLGFVSQVLQVYGGLSVLITGRLPQVVYSYQLRYLRWAIRVHLRAYHMADGYPQFGLNGSDVASRFSVPYLEHPDRVWTALRLLAGPIILLPHIILWSFRNAVTLAITLVAGWVVLFTRTYPENWYRYNEQTLRWIVRVAAFQLLLTDRYPPFHGR